MIPEINPMPAGFSVDILDDGKKLIKATVEIDGKVYEDGLRPARTPEAMREAVAKLTFRIWRLMEYHRLGRLDLMRYASVDRHKRDSQFLPIRLG